MDTNDDMTVWISENDQLPTDFLSHHFITADPETTKPSIDVDSAANSKRRRIGIACESCRERKLKCNGAKPICHACEKSNLACTYRNPARRSEYVFKSVRVPKPGDGQGRMRSTRIDPPPSRSRQGSDNSLSVDSQSDKATSKEIPTPVSPTSDRSIRIPFFRYFGPTGIAPGYKRMLFDVRQSNQIDQPENHSHSTVSLSSPKPSSTPFPFFDNSDNPLFESDKLTPRSDILFSLLHTFFERFACHFPFLSKAGFLASVRARKVSALLLNGMCALAARFSSLPELQGELVYLRGEVFASKAKLLLVPLLNLPSHEVVLSILMIAWHELASNHDVGLWMYVGMASRMAVDLGMEKAATTGPDKIADPEDIDMAINLFWAVNFLDHIICFATGRPLTIRRDVIDVPFPTEPHLTSVLPSPFPATIRIIQYQGLVSEEIGMMTGTPATHYQPLALATSTRDRLMRYSDELIAYYTSLHPALQFDVQNFRDQAGGGQGGTFLLLHLWFNAAMITIHRPGLRYGQQQQHNTFSTNNHSSPVQRDNLFLCAESRQISLSSARTISSILNLAELVDPQSVVASPFIDQAIEMAGLVFAAESKALAANPSVSLANSLSSSSSSAANTLERLTHQSNYQICVRALQALQGYWRGIAWVLTTMQQTYRGEAEPDPAENAVDPHSLIVLSDTKMIQKLIGKVKASSTVAAIAGAPSGVSLIGGNNTMGVAGGDGLAGDGAIGIGVTGMTNQPKGSITILESSTAASMPPHSGPFPAGQGFTEDEIFPYPNEPMDPSLGLHAFTTTSQTASVVMDGSDLGWMSWLDTRVWQDVDFSPGSNGFM